MCVCLSVYACTHFTAWVLRSERNNLGESVLFFHYVEPGDRTQVIRLGSRQPYTLNHFTGLGMWLVSLGPWVYYLATQNKQGRYLAHKKQCILVLTMIIKAVKELVTLGKKYQNDL